MKWWEDRGVTAVVVVVLVVVSCCVLLPVVCGSGDDVFIHISTQQVCCVFAFYNGCFGRVLRLAVPSGGDFFDFGSTVASSTVVRACCLCGVCSSGSLVCGRQRLVEIDPWLCATAIPSLAIWRVMKAIDRQCCVACVPCRNTFSSALYSAGRTQ